ncbi:MAG TPA: sulfur oxidation c-type cytochrome SoxX [Gammaproteobacteria bacterium]|nr:sulfur oxidation c-type cytochrome SoxX [Gammaproteobacteria bacterium]
MGRCGAVRYLRRYGIVGLLVLCVPLANAEPDLGKGRFLVMDRQKGNCLACHQIADGKFPGNIGPPLVDMRKRFVEAEQLFAQIWDATQFNAQTVMPPYGRNKILTQEEINHIVEFLYSL